MPDTIIENPILNSPFREPDRHWRFIDEGITNEIVETRRASAYFVPIPPPKKKGKQLQFDTEWTQDRIEPNVNRIRQRVKLWREREFGGVTQVTRVEIREIRCQFIILVQKDEPTPDYARGNQAVRSRTDASSLPPIGPVAARSSF